MNNKIENSDNTNDNNNTSSSNSSSGSGSGSGSRKEEEERKKNDDDESGEEFEIGDDTIVVCQEMNDNHIEEHTFKELVAFCACGKTTRTRAETGRPFPTGTIYSSRTTTKTKTTTTK